MALASNEITSGHDTIILYLALTGAVFAIIVTTFIVIHIAYHFRQLFCTSKVTEHKKTAYILVMIYSIIIWSNALILGFVHTNFFTGIETSEFTATQCQTAFIFYYFLLYSGIFTNYMVFIWRVRKAFEGTEYQVSRCVYLTLYFMAIFQLISAVSDMLVKATDSDNQWVVYYSGNLAVCERSVQQENGVTTSSFWVLWIMLQTLFVVIINVTLLIMFNWRLCKLGNAEIKQKKREQEKSNVRMTRLGSASAAEASGTNSIQITVQAENRTGDKLQDERISQLFNVIKKVTILVWVSISSTILISVWVGINDRALYLMGWDQSFNVVCVWMMFRTSKRYWDVCTRYGCCCCCYRLKS